MTDGELDVGRLARALAGPLGSLPAIEGFGRLTGGATKRTYAFDAVLPDGARHPLILQQSQRPLDEGKSRLRQPVLQGDQDARVMMAAAKAGAPVPEVVAIVGPEPGLSLGFVTRRVDGETLAPRILKGGEFARARGRMAGQCGEILARIHATETGGLDFLPRLDAPAQVELYWRIYRAFDVPLPAVAAGLAWARAHARPAPREVLLHGDFRHGNFVAGPDGVRVVLDWEVAHLGDPHEDLAWISVKTWRFGGPCPVGGFGEREGFLRAYEAASGHVVDRERVAFWEAFGSVKWAIMCLGKGADYRHGGERNVEECAIGRRMEEPLIDFFDLVYPDA